MVIRLYSNDIFREIKSLSEPNWLAIDELIWKMIKTKKKLKCNSTTEQNDGVVRILLIDPEGLMKEGDANAILAAASRHANTVTYCRKDDEEHE